MRQTTCRLATLERGSSRRTTVMRFRPANIGVIHRRCRSVDHIHGVQARPAGGNAGGGTEKVLEKD